MPLRVAEPDATELASTRDGLFLGIITADHEVRLRMADAVRIIGHREWLAQEHLAKPVRGFSLHVKGGRVTALFPLSRLNPTPDAMLENSLIDELERLLPLRHDYKVFRE